MKYTVGCFQWNKKDQDYTRQASIYDPPTSADDWFEAKNQYNAGEGEFEYSLYNEQNECVDSFKSPVKWIF